jgi:uncharacterized protein YutE (UPF0331/DUF86 family)
MDNKTKKLIEKAQVKDTLEQVFKLTLDQRVDRYIELRPHGIIPNSHFAAVSAECHELYRDGHFYGTISLAQSVAEALAKFLCQKNRWKPNKDYEKNIKQLKVRNIITPVLATLFINIWKDRNNYHHLNLGIEQDRQKLEALAKDKLTSLKEIEKELFAYSAKNGKLIPKYVKYWDQKQDAVSVFLRFD